LNIDFPAPVAGKTRPFVALNGKIAPLWFESSGADMNKLVVGSLMIAAAAWAVPAKAADLPVKAAPPVEVLANWTGSYIGVGAGWMRDEADAFWPNATPGLVRGFSHSQDRGVGTLFTGANYQWGQFVIGYEGAGIVPFDGERLSAGTPNTGCPNPAFTCQAGIRNLYTLGGKLGWAPTDYWLIYGIGGWARGEVRSRSFANANGSLFDELVVKNNGWFAGAGIDWVVNRNKWVDLIIGVQYQHVDLGGVTFLSPGDLFSPLGINRRDVSSITADIVTARLSVKWNQPIWAAWLPR
jgi:outer membrane immunogenic protein